MNNIFNNRFQILSENNYSDSEISDFDSPDFGPSEYNITNNIENIIFDDNNNIPNEIVNKNKCVNENLKIVEIIDAVSSILNNYRTIYFMHPDWLNCKKIVNYENNTNNTNNVTNNTIDKNNIINENNKDNCCIYYEIGLFIMTRIIDMKYQNITNFQGNLNTTFERALWHIASTINFLQHDYSYTLFMYLYDAFCLLSRPKSCEEFEESYRSNYKNLNNNNNNITNQSIPIWIYHKYYNITPPYLNNNTLTNNNYDPELFFCKLSDIFKMDIIKINLLGITLDNILRNITRKENDTIENIENVDNIENTENIMNNNSYEIGINNNILNKDNIDNNNNKYYYDKYYNKKGDHKYDADFSENWRSHILENMRQ